MNQCKEAIMKLRPLEDRVVIKQSDAEEKTTGGIILPDTAKEKPHIGKVIATGPGKMLDNGNLSKMSVKKNDKVIYAKYMGNDSGNRQRKICDSARKRHPRNH